MPTMRGARMNNNALDQVDEEESIGTELGNSLHSPNATIILENSLHPTAPLPSESMTESSSDGDESNDQDYDTQYMSLGQQYGARSKQRRQEKMMKALLERQKQQMHALIQSNGSRGGAGSVAEQHRHTFSNESSSSHLSTLVNSARPSMVMGPVMQSMQRLDIGDQRLPQRTFEGYMLKKGQRVRNWKRRFFQLIGQELKYSEGPGEKPKGFGLVLSAQKIPDLPYGMSISLAPNRILEVQAESTDEMEAWLQNLNEACGRDPSRFIMQSNSQPTQSQPASSSRQSRLGSISSRSSMSQEHEHTSLMDTPTVCEGWLYKQGQFVRNWKKRWFILVNEVLSYREMQSSVQVKGYGRVQSVERSMTTHAFGLVIELDNDRKLNVYAEDADTQKRWHRAIAQVLQSQALPSVSNTLSTSQTLFKQSKTHGSFIKNFSGWMSIPAGLLNTSWKRCFFTLHGVELAQSDDTSAGVTRVDSIQKVAPWSGKAGGLEFHMTSNRVWRVLCPSVRAANAWLAAVEDCQGRARYTVEKFLKSCAVKHSPTIMCGWLTRNISKKSVLRQFYVLRNLTLSIVSDVDVPPLEYDVITGLSPSDKDCALELRFQTAPTIVVECDTVNSLRHWHRIIRTCLNEPHRALYP